METSGRQSWPIYCSEYCSDRPSNGEREDTGNDDLFAPAQHCSRYDNDRGNSGKHPVRKCIQDSLKDVCRVQSIAGASALS